ncbi:two component transcriptional regulator, LytTR family [Granulicella rosea]|uniref:Two component transcriptional regulator, LytTR family n=1 Tax=Granulicella rosea TaxID=474952 RepID=A0A239LLT0_9BACT|nr:LytTR family DNA-binding domain-containing protein [Granulicella rosea]SNT31536.1 two component transcriptional regulator, LytTR family [Granulicella rosea]
MKPTLPGIRVLVVDDEDSARLRITDLLRADPDIGEIAEACNGQEALQSIQTRKPDLLLLDIQMPGMNGFELIDALGPGRMPLTVFVTAYDQHAIRAFEANALDYLLKPFSDERMQAALARAKGRMEDLQIREFGQGLARALSHAPMRREYPDRLAVKSDGVTRFVTAKQIDWIEAAGPYVTLHIGGKQLLHRHSLTSLLDQLDPRQFVRVHRSTVVNLESIVQLEPLSHGEFEMLTRHGGRLRVSRTYRAALEARLGHTF